MERSSCSVRLTRRYDASVREVWRALTDPDSIARWLGTPVEISLQQGGRLDLELHDGTRVAGCVRDIRPDHALELEWRGVGEGPSIVRFELSERDGRAVLVLEHKLIDARYGMAQIGVWERALLRFAGELRR